MPDASTPTTLVLGGGGFLGLHTVDALQAAGLAPRCGRRRRSNVLGLRKRKVQMVPADLDDPASLLDAMQGCEIVVHLAGHYPKTSLDPKGALALGLRQSHDVLEAAATAGVRRLIYVSSTATVARNPGGLSDEGHTFPASPGHGTYHDLKWHMEQVFLAEDRLEVLVACPAACLGPGDLRVGTCALLVALAWGMDPPHPDGDVPIVDVRDLGRAVARLALADSPPRRVILAGHNSRLQPLLETTAERYRVAQPSAAISADQAFALADAAELAVSGTADRPALSREIVDLVVHGVPLSARLAEDSLGMIWTPLSDTLDDFDAWARRLRILPPLPEPSPCSPPFTKPASTPSSPS
ncbi:MAG: NAD(P)H-binding protein [Oligoflexia bacterium]|nr:NAD(P)H-binding protein [Oligoflexia bacterium]